MFFRKPSSPENPGSDLSAAIAAALPSADEDTQQIVVAIAGLLGCVSYADQHFSDREKSIVQTLLSSVDGISGTDPERILSALEKNIILVSTVEVPRYCRALKQRGDRDLRLHVLDMLLDVAAADQQISHDEVVVLRQITTALGLNQADYNSLQSQHRTKLASLKGSAS